MLNARASSRIGRAFMQAARTGLACCLLLLVVPLIPITHAAEEPRVKRPMHIHRVAELNLEIWTEVDPEWETRLERQNGQPIFAAETPALTYPPAGMTWVSVRGMAFAEHEMREAALGAIHGAAANYGVTNMKALELTPARYGVLTGFETRFSANAHGTPVDVLLFFGHQPGKDAVLAHAFTLKGKLTHISENIRRSWTNLRYLK